MPDATEPDRLLTIGQVARASGLSASALRFYDREGVLVPADVDPWTGYRRYAAGQLRAARLVASLRRVGMPLAEVSVVLEQDARGEVQAARDVVAAHEQRLVDGLRDARAEVARTIGLLGDAAGVVVRVRAADLADAVRAVRFAVAPGVPVAGAPDGPDLTVLTGVLVEVTPHAVRLVATDRYRLAVAEVPRADADTGDADATDARAVDARGVDAGGVVVASAVAPVAWADEVAARCVAGSPAGAGTAEHEAAPLVLLDVRAGALAARMPLGAEGSAHVVEAEAVPGTFPDHRGIVEPVGTTASAVSALAGGLAGRLPVEADRVGLALRVAGVEVVPDAEADVFVDPEFLHEALTAAGPGPTLVLDGPTRPLAIRGQGAGFSVLMPVAVA